MKNSFHNCAFHQRLMIKQENAMRTLLFYCFDGLLTHSRYVHSVMEEKNHTQST